MKFHQFFGLHLWPFITARETGVLNDKSNADWGLKIPNGVKYSSV